MACTTAPILQSQMDALRAASLGPGSFCIREGSSFDGHVIEGYLSEELFDEYEDTYFDEEDTCAGEWIKIYKNSSRGDVPEGSYLFEIPSIEEILDGGKKGGNEYISEDHEIVTEWVDEIDEEDFKNIIYGVYGFGREVLFDDGFVIQNRYNG